MFQSRRTKIDFMETLLKKSDKNDTQIVSNECCMCGDVGFKKQLFKCTFCNFRYQHNYCSSLYPNIDLDCFSCEWCRVTKMAEMGAGNSNINDGGFNKLRSFAASKQVSGLKKMHTREEVENKSGFFYSSNGRQRPQRKEKPKLHIHAGRRYKLLADF
ncbi:hypothetical protein SUGI_0127910 [Cryptomeria japonica]|uniref:uncharacterized protein LOC131072796 n=1 Tax=Cryptomeria japonica TaxID=3369 RepID=UPI002408A6D7|nr:uncharacterized protein LOC131072796 [Cryptomeria japonica]GLJ10420.1 hypothetical protein SUGI_0127910 [Cryptomeria japonica]